MDARDRETFGEWKSLDDDVAVEIVEGTSMEPRSVEARIRAYEKLAIRELVLFCSGGPPGRRIRVWDRGKRGLFERRVVGERTPCHAFGLVWQVQRMGKGEGLCLADHAGKIVVDAIQVRCLWYRASAAARFPVPEA